MNMSCNNYYSIRHKLLVVSAALAYAAVTTASTHQAAATTGAHNDAPSTTSSLSSSRPSSSHPNNHNDNNHSNSSSDETSSTTTTTTMVPTFSCGSHWKSATQCNQLCIDGNDSSCPAGQYCYAGIPCPKSNVEELSLKKMERELMERLIWERDNNSSVKAFVCGVTFLEAESSCSSSGDGGGEDHSVKEIHYCNSGQSSECPSNMQCYASVACSNSISSTSSSPSSAAASSSSLPSTQQTESVLSFSSPTANVTPIINHEEDSGGDDDVSLSYYYSFHNIVGTMGSRLWSSLGAFSYS